MTLMKSQAYDLLQYFSFFLFISSRYTKYLTNYHRPNPKEFAFDAEFAALNPIGTPKTLIPALTLCAAAFASFWLSPPNPKPKLPARDAALPYKIK